MFVRGPKSLIRFFEENHITNPVGVVNTPQNCKLEARVIMNIVIEWNLVVVDLCQIYSPFPYASPYYGLGI